LFILTLLKNVDIYLKIFVSKCERGDLKLNEIPAFAGMTKGGGGNDEKGRWDER